MAYSESRIIGVDNKVFTLEEITRLADFVWEQHLSSKSKNPEVEVQIFCQGRTSFKSQDVSIFSEEEIFKTKRVISVEMAYEAEKERSIRIVLTNGDNESEKENFVEISGDDKEWVRSTVLNLQEIVDSIPNQDNPILKRKIPLATTAWIVGIAAGGPILDFIDERGGYEPTYWERAVQYDFGNFVGSVFAAAMFGGLVAYVFFIAALTNSYKVWPDVELQIGPENTLVEKKKKAVYVYVFTAIVVPVIFTIISLVISSQ